MSNTDEMQPDPWQSLSDEEREALTLLAKQRMGFETLEERGRDRLDFKDVAVWTVRDALARAFLAGVKAKG
mgnify:CR=1 FL=1|jgi:hypothetical protein